MKHYFLAIALACAAMPVLGQDDDDEQPPGLRAQYQVNESVVERIDPDISFVWDDAPPDIRLPSGRFSARWTGSLLLRSADQYRFHAYAQGRVLLKVNGQTVLDGQSAQPGWISGPETALSFGDQPLELSFEQTADRAQLKLYWSSREFPLEPVPYHALFQSGPSLELSLVERGRVQFDAFRCGNCHPGGERSGAKNDSSDRLEAPSLKHVGVGTRREWLVEKLMLGSGIDVGPSHATNRMPHMGLDRDAAEAIVATLLARRTPVDLMTAAKLKETDRAKDLQAGSTLIRSIGCLACHTWNTLGEATPFGGGSLTEVAERRSADWLTTWLANPSRLNARHRMPVVTLTDKERAQIVLALTSSTRPNDASRDGDDRTAVTDAVLAHGTKLMEEARCSHCHELPATMPVLRPARSLADAGIDWERGCPLPPDRARNRPGFVQADAGALRAYVASWRTGDVPRRARSAPAGSLAGRRVLERKNCLGCHDRDDVRGISRHAAVIAMQDPVLTGQQMTLIPPRLNAVGDRMHDAGLAEAVRGEQKSLRLNWLRVRMPKFAHSPDEQAALLGHLVGHDRIPEGGPNLQVLATPKENGSLAPPDPQRILAGRELLGGKGFSCVACHAVKDYTPKVTALGTRGSNLHMIGQRMRSDYFFRWTRAPLRVMPGVEMPNYQRPHEFILPGSIDTQLIAIWDALNDPNLTAPTNPAVVEQLLAVGPSDRPRVVRDVFTIPGAAEKTVARAYAVGLAGGHSMLFDLDTGALRGWTLGDFARQRCEGKRWYWDLAGAVLASGFDGQPEVLLVHNETNELIGPDTGWTVDGVLRGDERNGRSVTFRYDLTFSKGDARYELPIACTVCPVGDSEIDGWERQLSAQINGPVWPVFRDAASNVIHDQVRIKIQGSPQAVPGTPATGVRFLPADAGSADPYLRVRYATSLRWQNPVQNVAVPLVSRPDVVTTVPGFEGRRLALSRLIMPTAMTWDHQQNLVFTSLKGHLYRMTDVDGQPRLTQVEEGLAAPFGVIEINSPHGQSGPPDLVVAHKPELLQLRLDRQGQVVGRSVLATGWGVTDDYHDWTCGIVRDSRGFLYVGLGSDYSFKNRPAQRSRWRGDILRIDSTTGKVESIARGLRYPTALAIDDRDRLFCSDQQGVQNTFNELNYIQAGHRYGVPSRHEPEPDAPADSAAVQIPHPWTRSVNGIVWVPPDIPGLAPIAGHFLGCEFNNNLLIRLSLQTVGDVVQGAVYPFSQPATEVDSSNFLGPLCLGISPKGEIYVGGLQDGGWAGGLNMGDIVRLTPAREMPNGIREIRATPDGFDIEFFHTVDPALAVQSSQYKVSGYTRLWKGDYATPDSGHHTSQVTSAAIRPDGRTVSLVVTGRKPDHVYDISVGEIGTRASRTLWPAIGHFTLRRIPPR